MRIPSVCSNEEGVSEVFQNANALKKRKCNDDEFCGWDDFILLNRLVCNFKVSLVLRKLQECSNLLLCWFDVDGIKVCALMILARDSFQICKDILKVPVSLEHQRLLRPVLMEQLFGVVPRLSMTAPPVLLIDCKSLCYWCTPYFTWIFTAFSNVSMSLL